ncbi:hypothetical protein EDB19DRAFT_155654 [Suillus lakei]|nr:hypothetical protein EDB19DRAFT_345276 [Suillus lakei]KAG1728543.1 hypothetical protein EDB19DRAFT_155654 [Suillus lakei]
MELVLICITATRAIFWFFCCSMTSKADVRLMILDCSCLVLELIIMQIIQSTRTRHLNNTASHSWKRCVIYKLLPLMERSGCHAPFYSLSWYRQMLHGGNG